RIWSVVAFVVGVVVAAAVANDVSRRIEDRYERPPIADDGERYTALRDQNAGDLPSVQERVGSSAAGARNFPIHRHRELVPDVEIRRSFVLLCRTECVGPLWWRNRAREVDGLPNGVVAPELTAGVVGQRRERRAVVMTLVDRLTEQQRGNAGHDAVEATVEHVSVVPIHVVPQ